MAQRAPHPAFLAVGSRHGARPEPVRVVTLHGELAPTQALVHAPGSLLRCLALIFERECLKHQDGAAAPEFPIDEIRYERPNLCGVVARPDYEPLETDNRTVEQGRSVIAPSPEKNIGSIVVCLTLSIGSIKEFIESRQAYPILRTIQPQPARPAMQSEMKSFGS
jgi:hypothetical protein